MPSQHESDTGSRQTHWPETNHSAAGNDLSIFFDQNRPPPIKLGPTLSPPDFLSKAVKSTESAPAPGSATTAARPDATHGGSPDVTNPGDSQAARNKLAQEALLANPDQIRKVFPTLMKDLGLKADGYLNMSEIDAGLKAANVSQDDKNLLTIFRAGYTEFSQQVTFDGTLDTEGSGINSKTLIVMDKAMNRNVTDDPILTNEKEFGWLNPVVGVGSMAAAGARYFKSTASYSTYIAVGAGALTGLIYELMASDGTFKDDNDSKYDVERNAYMTFVDDFKAGRPPKTEGF